MKTAIKLMIGAMAVVLGCLVVSIVIVGFAFAVTDAHAAEPFDARATLQRAGVGQHSTGPAVLPLVDIRTPAHSTRPKKRHRASAQFERMECRPDYAIPEITVCEIKD